MTSPRQRLHVAVGVVRNPHGELLIARRADNLHQGGLWEFPGGKVELGEGVEEALRRELQEELGIDVQHASPLKLIRHDYTDRSVLLDVWCIDAFVGEPRGLQGQPLRWVLPADLRRYDFPRGNQPIITTLLLPRRMLVTGDWQDVPDFERRLEYALQTGVQLVQLRAHACARDEYRELFARARHICDAHEALLIANTDVDNFYNLAAEGLHLTTHHLMALSERPVSRETWLGASCHNLSEIRQAEKVGADYISLGPVLPTQSHPGRTPLGWDYFADLVKSTSLPVFGLGGLRNADEAGLQTAGAHGLAAIRNWW